MASEPITRAEMEARFVEERRLTQALIEATANDQQARLERSISVMRASIQQLGVKIDETLAGRDREWAALRTEVDAAQHNAALALGGYDAIKSLLREAVADIKAEGRAQTDELARLVQGHNAAIARWQGYEKLAGGVIGFAFQLPLLRWLGALMKWVFAIIGGVGLGAALSALVLAIWR